jgi:hypothetical protein
MKKYGNEADIDNRGERKMYVAKIMLVFNLIFEENDTEEYFSVRESIEHGKMDFMIHK